LNSGKRFFGSVPVLLWGIIGLFLGLAIFYSTTTPLFEKPDENWHFAVAMYLLEEGTLPQNKPDAPVHYAQQQANQAPFYYLTLSPILRLMGFQELTTGYLELAKRNEGARIGYNKWLNDNQRFYIQGRCEGACAETLSAGYVGRALSIVYVSVGILFMGLAVRRAFPDMPALWALTSALVAFNPQVLHIASSVSNDGLSIMLMSMGVYLVIGWLQGEQGVRQVALMGLVAGLALLTKVSAGALGLMIGLLLLWGSKQRIRDLFVLGVASFVACGWWIIYNLIVYGELTGVDTHMDYAFFPIGDNNPIKFAEPLPLSTLPMYFRRVVSSFWAEFGWGNIVLSDRVMDVVIAFVVGSLVIGLLVIVGRWRKWSALQQRYLLFLLGLAGVVVVLFIRWMMVISAPHGRLVFPAIFPLSLMMALGLVGWMPSRWRLPVTWGMIVLLFVQAVWMPFRFIIPAYAVSPPIVVPEIGETVVSFYEPNGGMILVKDVVLIEEAEQVIVQITWQLEQPFQRDYLVFVHLLDEAGNIIAQRDNYPMMSNYPFTLMKQGETLDDIYLMYGMFDGQIAGVRLGLYEYGDMPNTWVRLPLGESIYPPLDSTVTIPYADLRKFQR
jgi:hypothetical protein